MHAKNMTHARDGSISVGTKAFRMRAVAIALAAVMLGRSAAFILRGGSWSLRANRSNLRFAGGPNQQLRLRHSTASLLSPTARHMSSVPSTSTASTADLAAAIAAKGEQIRQAKALQAPTLKQDVAPLVAELLALKAEYKQLTGQDFGVPSKGADGGKKAQPTLASKPSKPPQTPTFAANPNPNPRASPTATSTTPTSSSDSPAAPTSQLFKNFVTNIIDDDIAAGRNGGRVVTRFPPEPNGYLHLGHAKSISINFGLAQHYGGVTHMRFDDTNPDKEEMEYIRSILDDVRWLLADPARPSPLASSSSFPTAAAASSNPTATSSSSPSDPWHGPVRHASDYFPTLYAGAEYLISQGLAYVEDCSAEQMRELRGSLTVPGKNSPYRERTVEENLRLFRAMRAGVLPDGQCVLRAKIDMMSPNMNLRDPTLYRIKRAEHPLTGSTWCIYPMYDYAHAVSDALEGITHSLCSLEFADHRPLYDWILNALRPSGLVAPLQFGRPVQTEFSRLNLQVRSLT